ncbi:unnamed protein product, partial [Timema podura]|nr:unnamed protein product [Timema podura]
IPSPPPQSNPDGSTRFPPPSRKSWIRRCAVQTLLLRDPVASEVDPNVAYCFQFTWMGPSYDNSTTNNSTCSDLTFEACKKPLVVTNDQTPPNTTTLWENYNSHVACKMAKGHVCAKWIYSFSGAGCPFTGFGRGGKVSAGAPDPGERSWVPLSMEVYHRLSNPDDVIIYFGNVDEALVHL